MAKTNLSIRVDSELKAEAQVLFAKLGLDISTAVNLFLRQAVLRQEIPFRIQMHTPDAEPIFATRQPQFRDDDEESDAGEGSCTVEEIIREIKENMANRQQNP